MYMAISSKGTNQDVANRDRLNRNVVKLLGFVADKVGINGNLAKIIGS